MPVLTAELLPVWLVQRGFVTLECLLLLVRGRAVHDEHAAWPKLYTQATTKSSVDFQPVGTSSIRGVKPPAVVDEKNGGQVALGEVLQNM